MVHSSSARIVACGMSVPAAQNDVRLRQRGGDGLIAFESHVNFRHLRLERRTRLALLNAGGVSTSSNNSFFGKTAGSRLRARGLFSVARKHLTFLASSRTPTLRYSASRLAPIHRDVSKRYLRRISISRPAFTSSSHVDSPSRTSPRRRTPKAGGPLVLETPDIDSLRFGILKSRWRQYHSGALFSSSTRKQSPNFWRRTASRSCASIESASTPASISSRTGYPATFSIRYVEHLSRIRAFPGSR